MSTRREHVPFDPYFFERHAGSDRPLSIRDTFRHIYETNHWSGPDSISGAGASRSQTRRIEAELPPLLEELAVDALLDLPCGDFGWMRRVELPITSYIGADIVPELIEWNQAQHGDARHRFVVLDLTGDPLPDADLLLCRDCLVHLSFADISRALQNVAKNRIPFLLTTTFPECEANEDITTGDWRVLNFERPPFRFPPPLRLINEGCTEGEGRFRDKSLGLWRVGDLPI